MADRTSAEMAGRVITLLDEEGVSVETIRAVWELVSQADFSPYQAEIDELRKKYGLDWEDEDDE